MMKILAVDSSSISASAAIYSDGKILHEEFLNNGLTHSENLLPIIEKVFNQSSLEVSDMDYLAITIGPGSFTGLRIGMATIKAFSSAFDIPCVGVSTLRALYMPYSDTEKTLCCVLDARCSQVYCALFKKGERLLEDSAMHTDDLLNILKEHNEIILTGDGAQMCYEKFKDKMNVSLGNELLVKASGIAKYAVKNLNKAVSAEDLYPVYLRLPQATRELLKKTKT